MTIKFYSITAKRNVLNKTLGTSTDLTGTLRDPCSLIDPDVLIESATVPAFNYAYIQDFGRYYFVTSIVAEQYNLFRVRMHVDVLMSWKGTKETTLGADDASGIYGLRPYITRAADKDTTVVDSVFPVEGDPIVSKKTATLVSTGHTWTGTDDLDTNPSGNTNYRFMFLIQGQILDQNQQVIQQRYPLAALCCDQGGFEGFMNQIASINFTLSGDPFNQFIYEAYALPTAPGYAALPVPWYVDVPGLLNQQRLPTTWMYAIPDKLAPIEVIWSFSLSEHTTLKYQNFTPYRRYFLQFLPWGKIELDSSLVYRGITNPKLYVRARVDPLSGNAALYYGPTSTNTPHYIGSTSVKITFPMSAQSYNVTKIASGALTLAASVASMIVTEGATAPAVIGASSGAVTAFSGAATPNATVTGGQQIIIDSAPSLFCIDFAPNQGYDDDLFGLPDCTTRLISRVAGYMEVGRVQIGGTGFSGILEDERRELEAILKGGIIV